MTLETALKLNHACGILNAYLAMDNIAKGGWWILLGALNAAAMMMLARSTCKIEEAIKGRRG